MTFRFSAVDLCLCLIGALPTKAGKTASQHPVADAITTTAIDIAANSIQTRLSRVPADGQIEIAFASLPQRQAERLVIKVIDAGETSVFMAAYQMTSKPIADALCRANARGWLYLQYLMPNPIHMVAASSSAIISQLAA